jgi:hypothetical protein
MYTWNVEWFVTVYVVMWVSFILHFMNSFMRFETKCIEKYMHSVNLYKCSFARYEYDICINLALKNYPFFML